MDQLGQVYTQGNNLGQSQKVPDSKICGQMRKEYLRLEDIVGFLRDIGTPTTLIRLFSCFRSSICLMFMIRYYI